MRFRVGTFHAEGKAEVKRQEAKGKRQKGRRREALLSSTMIDEARAAFSLNFCLLPFAFCLLP
jgi:hypothetical protein